MGEFPIYWYVPVDAHHSPIIPQPSLSHYSFDWNRSEVAAAEGYDWYHGRALGPSQFLLPTADIPQLFSKSAPAPLA